MKSTNYKASHYAILPLRLKRPEREADHSPTNAIIKNAWSYASTSPYIFMAWCLIKNKENVTIM